MSSIRHGGSILHSEDGGTVRFDEAGIGRHGDDANVSSLHDRSDSTVEVGADNVIEVRDLRKTYGSLVAVDDVSFSVRPGEIFGILGPQWCRKDHDGGVDRRATAARCGQGAGTRPRSRGRWSPASPAPRRSAPAGDPAGAAQGLGGARAFRLLLRGTGRLAPAARAVGSHTEAERIVRQPLGRAAPAPVHRLALVGDPEVVILDELTSGLDPQTRRATWELVRAVRDAGTTVVLVTHLRARRACADFSASRR